MKCRCIFVAVCAVACASREAKAPRDRRELEASPRGWSKIVASAEPKVFLRALPATMTTFERELPDIDDETLFTDEEGRLTRARTYSLCHDAAFGSCVPLRTLSVGCRVLSASVAPDEKYLLLWYQCGNDVRQRLELFDSEGRRTGGIENLPARWWNQPLSWVTNDNVLAQWGCGSDCPETVLYDPRGKLLFYTGSCAERSGDYLGVADDESVRIFSLANATLVTRRSRPEHDFAWLHCGTWQNGRFVLHYRRDGVLRELVTPGFALF